MTNFEVILLGQVLEGSCPRQLLGTIPYALTGGGAEGGPESS